MEGNSTTKYKDSSAPCTSLFCLVKVPLCSWPDKLCTSLCAGCPDTQASPKTVTSGEKMLFFVKLESTFRKQFFWFLLIEYLSLKKELTPLEVLVSFSTAIYPVSSSYINVSALTPASDQTTHMGIAWGF